MGNSSQFNKAPKGNRFLERLKSDWHVQVLFSIVVVLAVSAGSLLYITIFSVETDSALNVQALFFGLLIVANTVLAVIIARVLHPDRWDLLKNINRTESPAAHALCKRFIRKAEATRNILFFLSAVYAGFYTYIMWSADFADGAGTYFAVCFIASVAVGAMNYFFICSIDYNSRLLLLEHFASAVDKPTTNAEELRRQVFSGSQIYEPAGNIFVLVGIGTTFLSLSFGLISLDPRQILAAEVVALQKFIACMGLALGVSVLGIIAAVLSQFMRGASASRPTEDVMEPANAPTLVPSADNTNQASNDINVAVAGRAAAERTPSEKVANDAAKQ